LGKLAITRVAVFWTGPRNAREGTELAMCAYADILLTGCR
jgi:hypothetical protein